MTVLYEPGYSLPQTDYPLTHARIAHSNNWLTGGKVSGGDGSKLLQENGDALLLESGDNILLEAQNSTATGYYATAPDGTLTYEFWKPASLPSTWEYNHTSSAECDYCAIAAHTMGTNGNSLQVQYHDGSGWVDLVISTAITSDEPIFAIFSATTASRWRIRVSSGTAPEIGVVKFGSAFQMQRPLFGGHSPIDMARQTILRSNYSETGEYLGRTKKRRFHATGYEWNHLTAAWIEENWPSMQSAVESEPFFIAWRPHTKEGVGFCQTDGVPIPSNMGIRDLMTVSLSVRARGYD
jgi:hypothetical protein